MVTPRRPRVEQMDVVEVEVLTFSRPTWMRDSACAEHPTSLWFPERGQSPAAALAICRECLVVEACLAYALADRTLDGVWGATTPDDRRRMRGAK